MPPMRTFVLLLVVLSRWCDCETVRLRLGNGSVRKIKAKSVDEVVREAGCSVFRDAKCTEALEGSSPLSEAGICHGDMVYADTKRKKKKELAFDPYPRLSRRNRRQQSSRVTTLKDLSAGYHELGDKRDLVCREARVSDVQGVGYAFGIRRDDVVECYAISRGSAWLARKLGLEVVGYAFEADKIDAAIAKEAATAQLKAMKDSQTHAKKFPFVTLLWSRDENGGLGLEAFEIAETFVQMVAEDVVKDDKDGEITLSKPAMIGREEKKQFDPAWTYLPLPIVAGESKFLYGEDEDLSTALTPLLKDTNALVNRCLDFNLLLRLSKLLTASDFDSLCAMVKGRLFDTNKKGSRPPKNFASVIKHALQLDSSSS